MIEGGGNFKETKQNADATDGNRAFLDKFQNGVEKASSKISEMFSNDYREYSEMLKSELSDTTDITEAEDSSEDKSQNNNVPSFKELFERMFSDDSLDNLKQPPEILESASAPERASAEDLSKSDVAEIKSEGLTEEQKEHLRENTRLPETTIENICSVDTEGRYHLKCRNEELAGKRHEATGIKYVEKTITVDGVELVGVFPEFPAAFECKIPDEIWENGDREIFRYCTEQLRDYLEAHPEEKALFNEQQLEQIANGEPYIKGYTWHHTEAPGKMQLVETKVHAMSGHTGGISIWCGGIR